MSSRRRVDISNHHERSHEQNILHTSLLEDIKTNTANINLNVDTLEVNTDGLETLLAGGLPSALTGSGNLKVCLQELGNEGSERLNVDVGNDITQLPTALTGEGNLKVSIQEDHTHNLATSANQTTANGHLATVAGAVSGTEMQVDVLTMPTVAVTLSGGATEAKQDVQETTLNAIQVAVEILDNTVDGNYLNVNANIAGTDVDSNSGNKSAATQRVVIATDDVNLSAIKSSLDSIDNCVDSNELQVDIVSSALPTGAATQSTLNDAEVHLGSIDGKITACNTGAVIVSASALPSGAATQSTLNDAEVHLGNIETSVQLLDDAIVTDDAAVTLGSQKGVAIMGFAGTQSVNANDACMLACSTAGRLEVDVKNEVEVTNPGSFTVQEDGDALTALQLIDDVVVIDDAAVTLGSQKGVAIMGFAGTQSVNANDAAMLACSTAGRLEVDVKNTVSTAVTNTTLTNLNNCIGTNELQVDIVASLPTGSNAIGKLSANSGVDIGDVDVTSISAGTNRIGKVVLMGNEAADGSGTERHMLTDSAGHLQIDVLTAPTTAVTHDGLTALDAAIGTDGSTGPAKCISIGGTNLLGGAIQEIACDGDGHLQIDVLSSALPSGAAGEISNLAIATKATLATTSEVKEFLSAATVNSGAQSAEFDTENYERVRFFGESTASVGTDIILMGSNVSGGTFYVLGENLRSETISGVHYVYGPAMENLPRFIKILNKSGSTNYIFTKLYFQGSGGRLAV